MFESCASPEAEAEAEPVVEPEPGPEPEADPKPESEPKPQAEAEPEPEVEAELEPEPEPELEPEPDPEPEPEFEATTFSAVATSGTLAGDLVPAAWRSAGDEPSFMARAFGSSCKDTLSDLVYFGTQCDGTGLAAEALPAAPRTVGSARTCSAPSMWQGTSLQ